MAFIRQLAGTNLKVSALGLGTVKLGRDQQVKYPTSFNIPDDASVAALLELASELGINLIDTAPAYGNSEERLGLLLKNRQQWVICTKVGEEFQNGQSHFDFTANHTRHSIERSLERLRTDYLDIVLIHSDGNDEAILHDGACLDTLREYQHKGIIKAVGMSTKTLAGGIAAAEQLDIVMLTYNLQQQDQAVVDAALRLHKGILVKKGLMSGHLQSASGNMIEDSMKMIFANTANSSMITGTINPEHLRSNVQMARAVLDNLESS